MGLISLLRWGIDRFAEQTRSASPRQGGIDRFAEQTRSASPRLGQNVARFTATDEVLLLYIAETNPISLCSHHIRTQKSNREVRRSPTWHSSKSESALERFEPVAVVKLWFDGRGTLFAPVAARRRKEFKRGIDTYAKHVCRCRRDGSQPFPLFVLFVLFGQAKRTP